MVLMRRKEWWPSRSTKSGATVTSISHRVICEALWEIALRKLTCCAAYLTTLPQCRSILHSDYTLAKTTLSGSLNTIATYKSCKSATSYKMTNKCSLQSSASFLFSLSGNRTLAVGRLNSIRDGSNRTQMLISYSLPYQHILKPIRQTIESI
jgi:hypothetical protein